MRFLITAEIPVEVGNAKARDGSLARDAAKIVAIQQAESAYFLVDNGTRTAVLVVNIDDPSDLPKIVEPWFLAFNAKLTARPAMVAEDLAKAGPAIEDAVKTYG